MSFGASRGGEHLKEIGAHRGRNARCQVTQMGRLAAARPQKH
jgi:hypothetical protein